MTHQDIAKKNIINACNWIIGDYYNALQDGCIDDLPSMEELQEEIYISYLRDKYAAGKVQFDKAPKEMRFAGSDFCKEVIKSYCEKSEAAQEIVKAAENAE